MEENEFINNETDDIYIESIGVDDLEISNLAFAGMRVCGTGLMMVIGCLMILRILKNV